MSGHHSEIEHWADRLRAAGFSTVDALRAKPYSPRVFLPLDEPAYIRQRAKHIAVLLDGRIAWLSDRVAGQAIVRIG
jgi:hypothetical protein